VHSHTKEWITAYDLCRDLAKECAALLTWDPIAKYALEGALRAHTELRKERSEDWMNLAVAYMRVCAVVEDEADHGELHLVLTGLSDVGSAQSSESPFAISISD